MTLPPQAAIGGVGRRRTPFARYIPGPLASFGAKTRSVAGDMDLIGRRPPKDESGAEVARRGW
jgi:hypothetical protein